MRTLLRNVATGLYFRGPDQWTSDATKAHNFQMIDRAVHFIQQWKLKDVELAFAFSDREVTGVAMEKLGVEYSES